MPVGKLYANGLTMGAGGNKNPSGGPRGVVSGWSSSAVRRHTRFLYSVDTEGLSGAGYALTLTLRDCPPTSQAWTRLRKEWLDQIRASGLIIRTHWVVEWTRRKVPHLHCAVYVDPALTDPEVWALLVGTWLKLAAKYGSGPRGQHMNRIDGPVGWLEYLSKHASRGVGHYQRQGKPAGWEKTGRLWGHTGDWPIGEPVEVNLTRAEFYRFRRLVRSWRVADARDELRNAPDALARVQARKRIRSARRMLRVNDQDLSRVRGVSEWIPESVGFDLLLIAAGEQVGGGAGATAPPPRHLPRRRPKSSREHF